MTAGEKRRLDSSSPEFAEISLACMSESPLVVWVKDHEFKYRYANKAFSKLINVEFSEVLGKDDYILMGEEVAAELRANDFQVREKRTSLRTIEDVPGADGILRRWLVQKFPIKQPDGNIWIGGSATNVTEWLSVEESLQDSEENYRRLVDASPYCIHEFDREGRILTINPAGVAMLGKTNMSEIIGTRGVDIVRDDDRARIGALLQRAFQGELLEYVYESTLGRWFKSTVVPIQDGSNEINSLLGITEDISARKLADDQLRASEERHRLVTLATRDPIWEIDLQTGQVSRNETHEAKFGERSPDSQDAWDWWGSRIHEEDRDRVVDSLKRTIDDPTAERWAQDYRFFDHHGAELYIQDRAFISREPDGSPRRIVGTMRDQTPLVQAMHDRERLLADAREAQRLESLGVLAGGIAHDFNNLLTVMLANVSLLQLGKSLDQEVISELEQAIEKASGICQQMLAYAGKGRLEMKPLSIASLVSNMQGLLSASVDKSVSIAFNLDHNSRAVSGDKSQLSQVIMNLVINAAESTENRGGAVSVTVREASARELNQGQSFRLSPQKQVDDYICLEVADDGVGIEQEKIPQVFDPFFTSKFTGRGMGLAAVRGIISGHNAGLTVESSPGFGTTFRVWLPATSEKVVDDQHSPQNGQIEPEVSQQSVLIVDDEAQVRLALSKLLAHHGFRITTASDGLEGLEKLRKGVSHDLILLDLTMPGMDGVATFHQIKQHSAEAKVLIMSGYEEQELEGRFSNERPAGFIKKPFQLSQLVETVQRLLDS